MVKYHHSHGEVPPPHGEVPPPHGEVPPPPPPPHDEVLPPHGKVPLPHGEVPPPYSGCLMLVVLTLIPCHMRVRAKLIEEVNRDGIGPKCTQKRVGIIIDEMQPYTLFNLE